MRKELKHLEMVQNQKVSLKISEKAQNFSAFIYRFQ